MRDYKELQYTADILAALDLVKKWSEKSSNKEIETMTKHIMNIAFYVNGLNIERKGYDMVVDEQHKVVRQRDLKIRELEERIRELELNLKMAEE